MSANGHDGGKTEQSPDDHAYGNPIRNTSASQGSIAGSVAMPRAPQQSYATEGEYRAAVPYGEPDGVRPVSEADQAAAEREKAAQLMDLAAQMDQEETGLPPWLGHVVAAVLLGISCILLLGLLATLLQTLSRTAQLPPWGQYVTYSALVLLGCFLAYSIASLAGAFLSLRKGLRVRVETLERLSRRSELRQIALVRSREAVAKLRQYLRDYPLAPGDERQLAAFGFTTSEIGSLREKRARLLDPSLQPSDTEWIESFQASYQSILGEVARRAVSRYSIKIGAATAAAPHPLMDTMLVLMASLRMVRDLCGIYDLRTSNLGAVAIVTRALAHGYLAGQMQEITEGAAERITGTLLGEAAPGVLQGVLKKLVGKGAEALANGLMLRRLGLATIRLLEPVA